MARRGLLKWDINLVLAIIALAAGLLTGLLRPRFFAPQDLEQLIAGLHHFVSGFDAASTAGLAAFAESLLRYGRVLVLIWACAALPKAYYAAFLVLYLRAMALGFSIAMMVFAFGPAGFVMALGLLAIQNLLTMPLYVHTVLLIAKNQADGLSLAYIKMMAVGVVGVAAASVIEVYISPRIFEILR